MGGDLNTIEQKIQQYKAGSEAVDISTPGQLFLHNVSANDQKLSDVMADLIAKIKPEENPLHTRVLDVWAVMFNQSLDTPFDELSHEHRELIKGILSKK